MIFVFVWTWVSASLLQLECALVVSDVFWKTDVGLVKVS